MCRFSGHKEPWGEFVDVKVNFPHILEKQLRCRRVPEGRVILGSVTDACQPAEAWYKLTRSCLEALALSEESICNCSGPYVVHLLRKCRSG